MTLVAAGLAAALTSGACGSGDVWVGQFQEGLDLDACAGTSCSGTSPRELAMPAPKSCDANAGAALIVDFEVDIPAPDCPRLSCQYVATDLDVAPDGSSWVVGLMEFLSSRPSELWVTHFDGDGEMLGNHLVATGVSFNGGSVGQSADLVVDARGHAFVLVYQIDYGPNADAELAELAWLTELDSEGEEVHDPIPLAGIAAGKLAALDGGGVVLAANALRYEPHSIVAALTRTGERVWSRADLETTSQTPEGAVRGLSTSDGAALVFAARQQFREDYAFGLTRFDEAGEVAWDVIIDRHMYFPTMAPGGAGDALIMEGYWIGYVRSDGTAAWTYELPRNLASSAFDAARERVYALSHPFFEDPDNFADEREKTELFAIAIDGESCARYAMPEGTPIDHLHVDAEERLYVTGRAAFVFGEPYRGYVLTRLRLPEE